MNRTPRLAWLAIFAWSVRCLPAAEPGPATARSAVDWFREGVEIQRKEGVATGVGIKLVPGSDARDRVVRAYRNAIDEDPKLSPAYANLAEIYREEGNRAEALELLGEAVKVGDRHQGFYAERRGALSAEMGRWPEACDSYALAVRLQPDNRAVRRRLLDTCVAQAPQALGGYLWAMIAQGQATQALELALEAGPHAGRFAPGERQELLAVVAASLGRYPRPAEPFEGRPATSLLSHLFADPVVGEGARQLELLRQGSTFDPGRYGWWRERKDRVSSPPRGLSPQGAFQRLARAWGQEAETRERAEEAEGYYRLAAFLDRREPEPEALTQLAEFYAAHRGLEALDRMMQERESMIVSAKGDAYSGGDWAKIYRFHSALGVIYSSLGRIGDGGIVTSATFQLEHALRIADEHPEALRAANLRLSPRVVNLLADAYEKKSSPERAVKLRVDRCDQFLKSGNDAAARELFRAIPQPSLQWASPNHERLYQQLRGQLAPERRATAEVIAPGAPPPGTLAVLRTLNFGDAVLRDETLEFQRAGKTLSLPVTLDWEQAQALQTSAARGKINLGQPRKSLSAEASNITIQDGNGSMTLLLENKEPVTLPFKVDAAALKASGLLQAQKN